LAKSNVIAYALALFKIFLFLIAGGSYGYFRDELYFLACAEHLAFGYPDHAPLSVWITRIVVKFSAIRCMRSACCLRCGRVEIVLTAGSCANSAANITQRCSRACVFWFAPVYLAGDNLYQ
jgi:hypothetical protein